MLQTLCRNSENERIENEQQIIKVKDGNLFLSLKAVNDGKCHFRYSIDVGKYINVGEIFASDKEKWIGTKTGIFLYDEITDQ